MRTNLETPHIPPRHPGGRSCAMRLLAVPVTVAAALLLHRRSRRVARDELVLLMAHRLTTEIPTET